MTSLISASPSRGRVWAVIPARGGSKSIPKKNLVKINGKSLIERSARVAKSSNLISRVILSTDDKGIATHGIPLQVSVVDRPEVLASDEAAIDDVLIDLLLSQRRETSLPEIIVLLQPTSPFVRKEDIHSCIQALQKSTTMRSSQTIAQCAHNCHSLNQRTLEDGSVRFVFEKERQKKFNKQKKPAQYTFGNAVAVKVDALLNGEGVFAKPSAGTVIPRVYAFDLDTPEDIVIAEALARIID